MISLFLKFFVFLAGIVTTLTVAFAAVAAVAEILPATDIAGSALYVQAGSDYVVAILGLVVLLVTALGLSATVMVAERIDD